MSRRLSARTRRERVEMAGTDMPPPERGRSELRSARRPLRPTQRARSGRGGEGKAAATGPGVALETTRAASQQAAPDVTVTTE